MTTIGVLNGCAAHLPSDFPKPPVIDLCAPVLTGQKGDPVRMVTYWRCRRTDSQEIRRMPSEYVQVGIPVDDWNEGQSYRSDVEDYFKNHKCSAK